MFPPIEFYSATGIINAFTSFVLAVFIFLKSPRVSANRYFAYFCLTVFFWSLFYFLWLTTPNLIMSEFYLRTCMLGVLFMPATFFQFVCSFLRLSNHHLFIVFNYIFALCVSGFVYTSLYAHDFEPFLVFYWLRPGYLFHIALGQFGFIIGYSLYLLFKFYKFSEDARRMQALYVFLGLFIAFVGGSFNFLCWYRVPIPPVANVTVVGYVLLITHAILKHRLMDIEILVQRSLLYTAAVSCVSGIYFLVISLVEKYLKGVVGYNSVFASVLVTLGVFMLSIPVINILQKWTNFLFLKANPIELAEQNDRMKLKILQSQRYQHFSEMAREIFKEISRPMDSLKKTFHTIAHADQKLDSTCLEGVLKDIHKIDDLLKMLNDYSNPPSLDLEKTDVCELLENRLVLLDGEAKKRSIVFFKSYALEAVVIRADKQQLGLAIELIIKCCMNMMPNGGQIWIDTETNEQYFIISIKDTGVGIAQEQMARIFDPIFRFEDRNKSQGLFQVFSIIENHNGRILVESGRDSGTEFLIQLPLV